MGEVEHAPTMIGMFVKQTLKFLRPLPTAGQQERAVEVEQANGVVGLGFVLLSQVFARDHAPIGGQIGKVAMTIGLVARDKQGKVYAVTFASSMATKHCVRR